jgi:CxxC motif-containing protein (DUF1111 family)
MHARRRWTRACLTTATALLGVTAWAGFDRPPVGSRPVPEVGGPLPGLLPDELSRFTAGRDVFEEVEDVADGLGPVFNADSCAACHDAPVTGGGGNLVETRFGRTTNGAFDPMTSQGGSLIQTTGIGAQGACVFVGEQVPPEATIRAGRRTTPLFGLGLVDAVPDGALLLLAAYESRYHPEKAGRANIVTDVTTGRQAVGRFGWKSQVPSLLHFSADAYLNEMGITTPFFPNENCPQGDCALLACDPVPDPEDDGTDVHRFHDFMQMLAPPPRPSLDRVQAAGSRVFDQIGCASCHVRTLATGPSSVRALRYRAFQPYSDFLLHDMGPLGDGIEQGLARGGEMRTAPLWGLHMLATYLHDGRATTIADAILAHDGQGRTARDRFAALPAAEQAWLLAFLGSL